MTASRFLAFSLTVLALASGCIPPRDNPIDPANIPDPPQADIDVLVDGQESVVGQRFSTWTFDASASVPPGNSDFDGSCFDWAISDTSADDPLALDPDAGWVVLTGGVAPPCVTQDLLVISTANTPLSTVLAEVADFDNGSGTPDGTGDALRWVRLTITRPNGASATVYKPITVKNDRPVIELGPDRRTTPGGRWWLSGEARRFPNVVVAYTDDPDLLTVRWRIAGELSTRLDLLNEYTPETGAPTDGYVDTDFHDGSLRIELPMSLDPSRSTLTIEARDFVDPDGVIVQTPAKDDLRVDVLNSLWAYSAQNGHLKRLDTSQFLGGFTDTDSIPLAYQNGRIFFGRAGGGQIDLFTTHRGLQATPPDISILSGTNSVEKLAGYVTAAGGGWWLQNGDEGTLSRFDATLQTFVTFGNVVTVGSGAPATMNDFYAGASGDYSAIADGGAGRIWVVGGEQASATVGQKVLLVRPDAALGIGNALVVPPVDPFGDNTDIAEARLLAPDGAGGVWVASDVGRRLTHITLSGTTVTVTPIALPEGCIALSQSIRSLASDPSRNTLWIGVTTTAVDSEAVCRLDLQTDPANYDFISQKVDSPDAIALHPDGSIYMIANDGQGVSRYSARSAASVEYIPLHAGVDELPGVYAADLRFMEESLLVTVSQQFPVSRNRRAMVVEAGEIHTPNDIDLGVDPYVFDRVRHVSDPVTGTVWVWKPDLGVIASYAPSGEGPLHQINTGYIESRAHLAYDPDARRVWFAFSDLWVGVALPPDPKGRLMYFDVPENRRDPPVLQEVAGVKVAMARGVSVIPSSAPIQPGRLCLAADLLDESIPDARLRSRTTSGAAVAGETPFALNLGTDIEMWLTADASTGECWASRQGSHTSFARYQPGGTVSSPGTGFDIRSATMVAPGIAWAVSRSAGNEIVILDQDSADPTTADPIFESNAVLPAVFNAAASGAFDPYWEHAWIGLDDVNGNIVRVTVGGRSHEAWRDRGVNLPRLESGR